MCENPCAAGCRLEGPGRNPGVRRSRRPALRVSGTELVIDTSVLIAIATGGPSREALLDSLQSAAERIISSVSVLEAGVVLRARSGEASVPLLYELIGELAADVEPFDVAQARAAIAAFGRFGKRMVYRAQLNFGDCAVYALAALRGQPVLATGDDFAATDLTVLRP